MTLDLSCDRKTRALRLAGFLAHPSWARYNKTAQRKERLWVDIPSLISPGNVAT